MPDPLERIGRLPSVRQLPDLLSAKGKVNIVGAAGSGPALIAARLMGVVRTAALIVCPGAEEAEEFAEDLNLFQPGLACYFPALEVLPGDVEEPSEAILRARLNVLRFLAFGETEEVSADATDFVYLEPRPQTRVVVTSVMALLQPTRSAGELREGSHPVRLGAAETPGQLVEWLVDNAYVSVPQVRTPGQYCLRGGILDVYSHGALEPVRIEFFGDEVDSLRTFNPETQLSIGRIERCQLTVSEHPPGAGEGPTGDILSYFGPDCPLLLLEPDRLRNRARVVKEQSEQAHLLMDPTILEGHGDQRPRVLFGDEERPADLEVPLRRQDTFGPDLDSMLPELKRICDRHDETVVYCIGPAEADRFRNLLKDRGF
ncbi:MAG: hypothetical protein PVJ27_02130, partial [Candidatus Brocadiaceae bacterium]